jgi:uncharacterized protein YkwD
MKYVVVVSSSILLASLAVIGLSAVKPEKVDASSRVETCTGSSMELSAAERQMLELHNKKRAQKGLRRFCVHPILQKIARKHSADMVDRDYFSHNTKGTGTTPERRAKKAGYKYRYFGENIGFGSPPDSVFRMWMNSSPHRSNILRGKYREIGIGAKTGHFKPAGTTTTVYTADFGTRL